MNQKYIHITVPVYGTASFQICNVVHTDVFQQIIVKKMLIYPPKPIIICIINDLSARKRVTWWASLVFGFCFKTMVKTLDGCFHPVKAKAKNKTDVPWRYPYYSCSCIIYCKNTEVCFSMMVWNDTWCSECEQTASLDPLTACNPHFYWREKKNQYSNMMLAQ